MNNGLIIRILCVCAIIALFFLKFHAITYAEEYSSNDNGLFDYTVKDGTCTITEWEGQAETVEIPSVIDGYAVTCIGHRAFEGEKIKKVIIPDGVTTIDSFAFNCCEQLTEVILPNSLKEIGEHSFSYCISLKSIQLPEGIERTGESVFARCYTLSEVILPDSLKEISNGSFSQCLSLKSIQLPDSLTNIGDNAFFFCLELTEIQLPQKLTYLGSASFLNTKIKQITLPDSLKDVGRNPFASTPLEELVISPDHEFLEYNDGVLYSINDNRLIGCVVRSLLPSDYSIKEGTEDIDGYAFMLCDGLVSVSMPDSVKEIDVFAFSGCSHLTKIQLSSGLKTIALMAFNCEKLEEIVLPDGIESLGVSTIYNCISLKRVVIPDSVTHLAEGFIDNCPNVVLVVDEGSYAEEVAQAQNYQYTYSGKKSSYSSTHNITSEQNESPESGASSNKKRGSISHFIYIPVLVIIVGITSAVIIVKKKKADDC